MKLVKIFSFIILLTVLFTIPCKAQTSGGQANAVMVCYGVDSSGTPLYAFKYDYVTEKPQFPGGNEKIDDFVLENFHYPEEAYNQGITGNVTCRFIVNKNGKISNISIFKGAHPLLNQEAMRIISSMPSWEPGRIDGVAVKVCVYRTVKFRR